MSCKVTIGCFDSCLLACFDLAVDRLVNTTGAGGGAIGGGGGATGGGEAAVGISDPLFTCWVKF